MMKSSMFSTAALLIIIPTVLWSSSQASDTSNTSEDCCLSTGEKKIPLKIVKAYKIQEPGNGCKIHAVMFLTKHKRRLCSPPEAKWVKVLMQKLDKQRSNSSRQRKNRRRLNKRKQLA
ncbi:C-C motif chemokine 19-like [Mustelus asterias]